MYCSRQHLRTPPWRRRLLFAAIGWLWLAVPTVGRAELSGDQKQAINEIATMIREAGNRFRSGDFEASGEQIEAAMAAIDEFVEEGGREAYDAVSAAFPRIVNAHTLLQLEGVLLPPFVPPKRPAAMSKPTTERSPSPEPPMTEKTAVKEKPAETEKPSRGTSRGRARSRSRRDMATEGPSFSNQIAPILVQHCGSCHIQRSRGDFNLGNFALLAQGTPAGTVIFPGDPVASRLIETIETGDMPRGGGTVPDAQLQLLKDWVTAGAKYDANSPVIPLAVLASQAPTQPLDEAMPAAAAAPTDPGVRPPSGEETVSFAKDVAPILLENCNGCHIDANMVRGGLRLDTFAALMRGGDSGEIISPNESAESLLVRRIKGEEGMRMPMGRPPLSDEQIATISKWIDENATFDGITTDQRLGVLASLAWAGSASEAELSERRAELARKNLRLMGLTESNWVEHSNDQFLLVGAVSEANAKAILAAATRAAAKVKSFADPTEIRGRITIYALPKRYDYSEFAKMVERRSVPSDWQGHWKYDRIDAYVAVLATPADSDAVIEARLAGPLTSLTVASGGTDVPRWFAEGVGRAAVAKVGAKNFPNVDSWNAELPRAAATLKDGKQFVSNGLPPEQSDIVGYGIVSTILRGQRKPYEALREQLAEGKSFDDAFTATFGVTPTDYIDRWKSQSGGRR